MEVKNTASFSGNVSFTTLKLLGNGSIYTFGSNYSYSVSDTFIMGQSGSCAITTVKSSSPGTTAHISSSDVVASSYLDMQDISFSGTGSFMANNSIDNGNNSGITFGSLSERDFYWIGGTGNWSDGSKWSLTSGGSPVGCPPTSADNIYFDESSFDASDQVVTIDIDNAACKNMSWASVTNTPKFDYQSKSLRVHGSYELSENMTIQSDYTYFTGTASVTLDSKGQRMNSVYIDGSDVSLSGPLDTSGGGLYTNSGVLTTNNYDINTGNHWYANVTQNATMTINLGTSSITCTYQYQARERNINNGQNNNSYGDLIMNNASATFIFKGNYFRNYAEIPWPRIITDRNEGDVYFDRYGDIDSLIQRGNGKIRLAQTWRDNGGPHGNHLNKIGYMEVKNTASFSGNVSFTTLKLLGNGSIYTFGSNYSYSVSDSFELNSPFGEVCTIKSSSNGSQTDISLGNISACIDYTSVQDVNFSSTTTVTAGPNSNDAGNNSGIQFFTDNSTTFQGINIISNVGTSIPDFQEGSFTATTTTGFPEGAVLNWYVNQELKQSGSSPHFSAGIIDHDYTVNCAMEMSYTGSSGNCSFAIKGKSNNIDMSVSRNPIIRETRITPDNQFIKVKFSKPVYTNSDGTGDLTTNDFRLYLNGGNAILSSSYPNSVSKEGEYYKLTFGLNNKLNGEEEITVKPHGDNNIYDNSGLKAYQNQSNNVVTLNYNPPIIDGVSVNSTFDEITVKWSEPVNGSDQPPFDQPVRYNSYHLSVTGGTATLNSTLPLSISGGVDTYVLKFALTGTPNGDEIFMVRPVYNSIFDLQGFAASHLQSYNSTCSNCDGDNDGLIDALDLCPNTPAGATIDQNGCSEDQKDSDYDGVPDYLDFCLNTPLGTEVEANGCEPEQEAPVTPPLTNEDSNSNDTSSEDQTTTVVIVNVNDRDNDGVENDQDQFPDDPNEFEDTDQDGTGDNADQDDDNDGFSDIVESQCETNSMDPQSVPLDSDQDQIADCIDKDDDNDGVPDNQDLFPLDDTEYLDTDEDGIGNNADQDDDNDLYLDVDEISCDSDPLKKRDTPKDFDKDLIPDCIDEDDDNDGCLDEEDLFPYNGDECSDVDGDGIGDNADMDADNDGVIDALDDFPTNANESKDTDGDGIGDNADQDDNNDGFPEEPITNSAGEKVIPIFISEILSPNQPGEESTWKIVNIDKYPTANVKIYTPTGIVVYESWNYKNDWNGSNKNGKPLPTGPYMYMIDRGDETQVEQGWLYIFN
jgi:gliding motility-associated-like protein